MIDKPHQQLTFILTTSIALLANRSATMSSVFRNSENITIHGGNITNVAGDQINLSIYQRGIAHTAAAGISHASSDDDILLSKLHFAKDAGCVGSKGCLNGTRVALLKRINDWAQNPLSQKTLLLNGAAGKERSSTQLIPTWMKHLAEYNSKYLSYLRTLQDDKLCSTDLVDQSNVLLRNGLLADIDNGYSIIFIVDALDECKEEEAVELSRVLQSILTFSGFPSFIRFFFTYRLDPVIMMSFTDVAALTICIDEEQNTEDDIYKFVSIEFDQPDVQGLIPEVAEAAQALSTTSSMDFAGANTSTSSSVL
ncbi:hypothetical protein H0H92_013586 [Tricholoma furcatifolium]|nr:hypothetical protein H0H92_013586 [Tricholoma furcatifolium]